MILMLNFILSIVFAGLIHELGHYVAAPESESRLFDETEVKKWAT